MKSLQGTMSNENEAEKHTVYVVSKEEYEKPCNVELSTPEENSPGLILEDGSINWDCPCLGGMVAGPCGVQFREAFSCFHFSAAEPKGSDCMEAFSKMQDCMQNYPKLYGPNEKDEDLFGSEENELALENEKSANHGNDDEKSTNSIKTDNTKTSISTSSTKKIEKVET